MRATWPRLMVLWGVLLATGACRIDKGLAPRSVHPLPGSAQGTVLPASAYTPHALPDTGEFTDVNDAQLIVGTLTDVVRQPLQAFALQWGGAPVRLQNGTAIRSAAAAVNQGGEIAGTVYDSTDTRYPAVWRSLRALPEVLPISGEAVDINDRGNAVGWMVNKSRVFAFFWDPSGHVEKLPPLPGGSSTHAYAVNIDNVVLGDSFVGGALVPVMWTRVNGVWTPQPLGGGITGMDLDNAYNVVGHTAGAASYGTPHHAGYFGVRSTSVALAVNQVGVAAGIDGTGPGMAFVADTTGQATYLPFPPGGPWMISRAFGLNNCGLVVGSVLQGSFVPSHPAVWDPKC